MLRNPESSFSTPHPLRTFALKSKDAPNYQRLDVEVSKWDIFEVFFVDIYLFAVAALATPALSTGGCAGLLGIAGSAQELHVVGDHVHLGALGAVLGFPGAVLEATFDQDGVTLLLIVGNGLAELAPRTDVEEIHLFTLGTHPVDREPERTDWYPVVCEPQLGIPRKVAREYDAVETHHR